jgi:hypothetical protein
MEIKAPYSPVVESEEDAGSPSRWGAPSELLLEVTAALRALESRATEMRAARTSYLQQLTVLRDDLAALCLDVESVRLVLHRTRRAILKQRWPDHAALTAIVAARRILRQSPPGGRDGEIPDAPKLGKN